MLSLIILAILVLLVLLVTFLVTSSFFGFVRTGVPFVPTRAADIEYVCRQGIVSSSDVFYELGSGDGKVVLLVEKLTGATVKGFELTRWTHVLARLKKKFRGSKAEFQHKDFFAADWSAASVIYGYLYPPLMSRVEKKFVAECRPGSRAIIRDFPFPTMTPVQVFRMPGKHEVYIYELV